MAHWFLLFCKLNSFEIIIDFPFMRYFGPKMHSSISTTIFHEKTVQWFYHFRIEVYFVLYFQYVISIIQLLLLQILIKLQLDILNHQISIQHSLKNHRQNTDQPQNHVETGCHYRLIKCEISLFATFNTTLL